MTALSSSMQGTFADRKFLDDIKLFEHHLNQEFEEWKETGQCQKDFTPTYILLRDLKTYIRDNDYLLHTNNDCVHAFMILFYKIDEQREKFIFCQLQEYKCILMQMKRNPKIWDALSFECQESFINRISEATRRMDELVDIQKQDRKTVRNREFRRKRGVITIEPKLSRAMNNLQKDGINKIVYEGLFTNEQEKKNKAKDMLAAQNSAIPIAPQGLIANPGCLPCRMTESEMQKYQQLREQNPLWNRFKISNEDAKEQAEYIQLIKTSEEKDNGKFDWYVSDEELNSTKNNSTTITKNNENSSCDSSTEGRMTFKDKLSRIKSNPKGDESSVESSSAERSIKDGDKLIEIDVEAHRREQRQKQKEQVKQEIQLEALAKIHGITVEEMRKRQSIGVNEAIEEGKDKNKLKKNEKKMDVDADSTIEENKSSLIEEEKKLEDKLAKNIEKNKETGSQKQSSRNASQKKDKELCLKDSKAIRESQKSKDKDLNVVVMKDKIDGSQKLKQKSLEKKDQGSQKKDRPFIRKSKSPEKKLKDKNIKSSQKQKEELKMKTSQEIKGNFTKKASQEIKEDLKKNPSQDQSLKTKIEAKKKSKSPEKDKSNIKKKKIVKSSNKNKTKDAKDSIQGSFKSSQSKEFRKSEHSSNHSISKDITPKSSIPNVTTSKELATKNSSQSKKSLLEESKSKDVEMETESHKTKSEKPSSPTKLKKGKKSKSSKKITKRSVTKKLPENEEKNEPIKKREKKALEKNKSLTKVDSKKSAVSETKVTKSVGGKKKASRLNKFIETSEEIGKNKKKKATKDEHQKVIEQIRRVSETNSISRTSQSSRVTSDNEKQSIDESKRDEEMRRNREHRRMKMKRLIEKEQRHTKKKVVEPIIEDDPVNVTDKLNLPDCPDRLKKVATVSSNKRIRSPVVSQAKSETLSKSGKDSPIKGSNNISKIQMIEAVFTKK